MQCPKCQTEQSEANQICTACGLVFEKYYKYHPPESGSAAQYSAASRIQMQQVTAFSWQALLFPPPSARSAGWWPAQAVLLLGMAIYGGRLIIAGVDSNAAGESFLHLINLPFHEGGHVIFGFLGQFMGSLGGTLMQLLMPAAAFYHFLFRQQNAFASSVCLWWFGENFLDIAPYIQDASKGVLPLLGGNIGKHAPYGFHDWEYLLTETGLIQHDAVIASLSHGLGSLLMLLAVVWGLLLVRQGKALGGTG